MSDKTEGSASSEPVNSVLRRNIEALERDRLEHEKSAGFHDRLAQTISQFAGNLGFVYAHLAVLAVWLANSLGLTPGIRPLDPSFAVLANAASIEAIFLSAFILISQNRAAVLSARRSDLDVQISLLTEHEVTRTLDLCTAIARKLGVQTDPNDDELRKDIAPERVLDEIAEAEADAQPRPAPGPA